MKFVCSLEIDKHEAANILLQAFVKEQFKKTQIEITNGKIVVKGFEED